MKKILLLLLLINYFSTSGQTFIDTTKIWTEFGNFTGDRIYYFDGDTVINSTQYKKLYWAFDSSLINRYYLRAMREDSAGKVYSYDNVETLLYDFNLQVNDTFSPLPQFKLDKLK